MGELLRLLCYNRLNSISTKAISTGGSNSIVRYLCNLTNFHRINNQFNIHNLKVNRQSVSPRTSSYVSFSKSKSTPVNNAPLVSKTVTHPETTAKTSLISSPLRQLFFRETATSTFISIAAKPINSLVDIVIVSTCNDNQPQGKPAKEIVYRLPLHVESDLKSVISDQISPTRAVQAININNDDVNRGVNRVKVDTRMGLNSSKRFANGRACTCSAANSESGELNHQNNNYICGVYRSTAFSGHPIFSSSKRCFSTSAKMSDYKGVDILIRNRLNKSLCFTMREREQLKLKGLLPPAIRSQEQEAKLAFNYINSLESNMSKYTFMRELQDRDERLFYKLLCQYTEQLMPIVYTPVVGEACIKYSKIFQRPRGLFVSIHDAGHIASILANWPEKDVKAIVVTDGERILGLGDLGANGMGIPVGKLSLFTALAGIPPNYLLPITLDVGTDNQELLNDPNYIGLRQKRTRGPQYDDFIDEFMESVIKRWGRSCLIQFEDFANSNAFRLLEKYQPYYCTFNDDIQGTASVAVAGIIASCKLTGMKISQHRFLFYGAGEAALGIAELLVMAMEKEGIQVEDARQKIWLIDSRGLITKSRPSGGAHDHKAKYAKDAESLKDLEEIVDLVKPTALIGVAAQPKAFSTSILKKMSAFNAKPLIFPLSNPTSKAECTAEEAFNATNGTCVFASGSPFNPVTVNGKTFYPGQGNNSYIFPGVSLAVIACGVHHIPNETFLVAAQALADQVSKKDLDEGRIYPPLSDIREVSLVIAAKTAQYFYVESLANERPEPNDKLLLMRTLQYDFSVNGSN